MPDATHERRYNAPATYGAGNLFGSQRRYGEVSVLMGTEATIGLSAWPSWRNKSSRSAPAVVASTRSFTVIPSRLLIRFTSIRGIVALAKRRPRPAAHQPR